MKITEISKEYLEKGGLIRRKGWAKDISISFNEGTITGEKKLTVDDITSDDWELVGKNWQPEEGETYFYINSLGVVESETYDSDTYIDYARLEFTNIFRTEEEANIMARKLQIIAKLRKLSNVDFNENQKEKWSVIYDFSYNKVDCVCNKYTKYIPFEACFKTKEECEKAIDTIGVENLKKYYFEVVNDEKKN